MGEASIGKYFDMVSALLNRVKEAQAGNIREAAQMIFDGHKKGGRFFIFGSGHSHIIAEELYGRAGGYAPVKAILCPELMLHEMPEKSTALERISGYAKEILRLYRFGPDDVLMVVSNSGRNNVPVEMCLEAQKSGGRVIAITSLAHAKAVESRHESGKRLFEIADLVLDNGGVPGDAAYFIDGLETPMGPTSTITGAAIAHGVTIALAEMLIQAGEVPPIFRSSNLDGSDQRNAALFKKYG